MKIPLIEKALAVYLGSYGIIKSQTSIQRVFQYLNYDNLESYSLKKALKDSYQDLLLNYFQPSLMRHVYFQMTQKLPPVGFEQGRVYAIVGLIKATDLLTVVYNPYIDEDPRKNGEMWSKSFLQNVKKNKKHIDLIVDNFGEDVYKFIADPKSNVYLYDFMDIL